MGESADDRRYLGYEVVEVVPRRQADKLAEALRWYVDRDDVIYRGHDPAILRDRGARARAARAEWEEMG